MHIIIARWDGSLYWTYEIESYPDGIASPTGDTWHDRCGNPADGEEFQSVSIRLVGGPRAGQTIV